MTRRRDVHIVGFRNCADVYLADGHIGDEAGSPSAVHRGNGECCEL